MTGGDAMKANIEVGIRNEFTIMVDDVETGEHREYKAYNIILDGMWERIVNFDSYFGYIHFGDGLPGTGENFDDTTRKSLYGQLGARAATDDHKSPAYPTSTWRRRIRLNEDEYVNDKITEVGIGNGTNIYTHAPLEDSMGNQIALGPKKGTEIYTLYADVIVTIYNTDYGLFFIGNGLRNYLLGGSAGTNEIRCADCYDDDSYGVSVLSADRKADKTNKTYEESVRFKATHFNQDIRYIHWTTMGARVELPRTGVFEGEQRDGVILGVGNGEDTLFEIPNRDVSDVVVYVDGVEKVEGTDWDFNFLGMIEFVTAPLSNLPINADYTCPYIPKNENNVVDVTFGIKYDVIEPTPVVTLPDQSVLPGAADPIAGNSHLGFYGEVPHTSLISGESLCDDLDISQGTLINSEIGWLKYACYDRILFVSKRAIYYGISWDHINEKGAAYGDRKIKIGNVWYRVRLLTSKEWDLLIVPVHVDNGRWGNYTNTDLLVASGNGRASWTMTKSGTNRVNRGNASVSYSHHYAPSHSDDGFGFRPCLESLLTATL